MGRSVVLAGAARCPACSLPPRWCVCHALAPVETGLHVHVLIHRHEQGKPSSTGKLVARAVTGSRCHVYQRQTRFYPAKSVPAAVLAPGRELWILHPAGPCLSASRREPHDSSADLPAILLLDGTWRQAAEMLRVVEGLGRCVSLPEKSSSSSRYWLRDQASPDRLSTAEALMETMAALDEHEAARRLGLHFELHVYATLLARGRRDMAERYLGQSPLLCDAPGAVERLHRRPSSGSILRSPAPLTPSD